MEFEYLNFLEDCGVGKGDIVDVASDIRSMMIVARQNHWKFDINHLIDALMELVGKEGTLLIRCFNWDFCHGKGFDIRTSPSRVGSLGNYALKRSEFVRTKNPMYSWMVWGKYANDLAAMDNKQAFGKDSPWDFLYNNNGKLFVIGKAEQTGFTYIHHIEERENMPYRFSKIFSGNYTDSNGYTTLKEYSMYVRYLDYDMYEDLFPELIDELYMKGSVSKKEFYGLPLWSTVIKDADKLVRDDLVNNLGKRTCIINGQKGYQYVLDHPPVIKDPPVASVPSLERS